MFDKKEEIYTEPTETRDLSSIIYNITKELYDGYESKEIIEILASVKARILSIYEESKNEKLMQAEQYDKKIELLKSYK